MSGVPGSSSREKNPPSNSGVEESPSPGSASTMGRRKRQYVPKVKGCYECSKRRINCDRTEPDCQKCVSKGLSCSGLGQGYTFVDGFSSGRSVTRKSRERSSGSPPNNNNPPFSQLSPSHFDMGDDFSGADFSEYDGQWDLSSLPQDPSQLFPTAFPDFSMPVSGSGYYDPSAQSFSNLPPPNQFDNAGHRQTTEVNYTDAPVEYYEEALSVEDNEEPDSFGCRSQYLWDNVLLVTTCT
ncbi:unnamed protein product [Clonostachys rhizophaga]|uniref:Zn(2)-C6 fungal-type domain-containing protein n=1 Tax=Clonostachys rhizophaga TaxID=160324 RepID=A0A9N9V3M1_9HYPO|nr:unnamed protein product [Clonostachys rhizophaga]